MTTIGKIIRPGKIVVWSFFILPVEQTKQCRREDARRDLDAPFIHGRRRKEAVNDNSKTNIYRRI